MIRAQIVFPQISIRPEMRRTAESDSSLSEDGAALNAVSEHRRAFFAASDSSAAHGTQHLGIQLDFLRRQQALQLFFALTGFDFRFQFIAQIVDLVPGCSSFCFSTASICF